MGEPAKKEQPKLIVWKGKKQPTKNTSNEEKFEQVRQVLGLDPDDDTEANPGGEVPTPEGIEIEKERTKYEKDLNTDVDYLKGEIKGSITEINTIIKDVRLTMNSPKDDNIARKTEVLSKLFDSKIKCTSQLLDIHRIHKFLLEMRFTEKNNSRGSKMTTTKLKELFAQIQGGGDNGTGQGNKLF